MPRGAGGGGADRVKFPCPVRAGHFPAEKSVPAAFGLRATFDRGAAATSDGTATAGSDYTGKSGTLTFAASETETTVATPVPDHANEES